MTPMDCAMQRGNRATAKYLQAHGGLPANRINNQEIVVEKSLLPENKIDSADEDYGEVTESNRKIAKNKKSKHKNADPSSKIVRVKKSLIPAELDKRSKSSCLANQSEKQSVTIPKENHKSHKGSKSAHNLKGESIKTTTCPPKIQGIAHIPSIETLAISIEENAKTIQNKITTLKIQNEDIQVKSVCKSEAVALIEGQLIDKIEVMHGLLTKLESQKEHEIRVDLTAISSLNDEIKTMRNDLKSVEEQVDMKLNKQIDIIRKELATLRTNYNLDDAPTEVRDDLIKEQQSELLSQLQNESELKSIPHIEKIADEIIIDDSSVVNVEHLVEDNLEILTPTSQSDKIGILSEKIPSDSKLEDFLSIHKQSDDEGIVPEIEKFDEVDIDKKYIGMESNIDDTIQLQSTEKYISEIQHNDDLGDQTNATADHTDKADETIYDIPEQYQKELEPCTELITQDHEEDRNYKSFTVINKRRKSAEENNKEKRSRSEESIQPKQSKIPLAVRNNKRWSSSKLIGAHERKLKSSTTNLTAASNHSLSTPINLNVLSDDIMNSETDNDEENNEYYSKSFHDRKRLVKRRFKPRSPSFNLHQSDYDSNVIDSGIEPSPRCVQRTCKDNVTSRSVNMVSVTQSLQSNIRRYHLERGIFQHLLDLKRLQIRSGKNNEQVMVKRAIDSFHRTCGSLPGMSRFKGTDYSFKIFEKFLYGILRKLQYPEDGYKKFSGLPNFPEDPLTCTRNTWRCSHATHAYTGIPCAAYLPAINHHTIPKIGFNKSSKQTHLPNIGESLNTSENVTLELSHGNNKQKISLPTERLDESKRYYVTFTVKDDEK